MWVLVLRRFFRVLVLVGGVCGLVVVGGRPGHAETCQVLRYTFQPECLHAVAKRALRLIVYLNY